MLEILKEKMKEKDYIEFMKDYNLLCNYLIDDKDIWKKAISRKRGKEPYIKGIFDSLINKYSYIEYKQSILSNKRVHNNIIGYLHSDYNTTIIQECIKLHYTIEIYIAFIVELLIYDMAIKKYRYSVYQNKVLDNIKKTDLLCRGKHYQIKSKSFIYDTYEIEPLQRYYKKYNKQLNFIFYSIEKDNIYICAVEDKPYTFIDDINNFSNRQPYSLIEIKDFIKYL